MALFGASSGGAVAAAFTARHPDRVSRLVLYGSYADGTRVAPPDVRESLVAMVSTHWGAGLAGAGRRVPARGRLR